jgi:hypothetical protein
VWVSLSAVANRISRSPERNWLIKRGDTPASAAISSTVFLLSRIDCFNNSLNGDGRVGDGALLGGNSLFNVSLSFLSAFLAHDRSVTWVPALDKLLPRGSYRRQFGRKLR